MTPKQEKLIENYVRKQVKGMLKEDTDLGTDSAILKGRTIVGVKSDGSESTLSLKMDNGLIYSISNSGGKLVIRSNQKR